MSDDLFGGGGGGSDFQPVTSSAARTPAYSLYSSRDGEDVSTSLRRLGTFPQAAFDQRFPRILSNLDALRATVAPGFSQLREARLNQVANARARGIGNLRENLARRRVQGSSFAENQVIQAETEFGQQAAQQEALSFLEELQANQQLLGFESDQLFNALQRELAELGVATNFASASADLFSRDQMFAANLDLQEAAAQGSFWGDIIGLGLGAGIGFLTAPSSSIAGGLFAGQSAGSSPVLGGAASFGGRATPGALAILR